MRYDVVVIGAGPGGYLAGIRIAQLGGKVLVIDKDGVGGECLNYACIPSKTLLYHASLFEKYRELLRKGVFKGEVELDIGRLQDIRERVVKILTGGVRHLFKKNGVEYLKAEAKKVLRERVIVEIDGSEETIDTDNIVLAMGSRPIQLSSLPFDHINILDSRDALRLREVPESILVVGGGAIGVELASYYSMLGSQVTVVELLDHLLPFIDRDISILLEKELSKKGIEILTSSRVKNANVSEGYVEVEVESGEDIKKISVDKVIVAVGRRPNTDELGLKDLGVKMDGKGFIEVDEEQKTSVDNIYAIGDITGPPMLAHKAYWEALNVAETLYGEGPLPTPKHYPYVIFSKPEVLSIGYSYEEAMKRYSEVKIGISPFSALGRATSEGARAGFIKVIVDDKSRKVLGIHVVGEKASVYSSIASLIVGQGLNVDIVDNTVFPHPTYGEGLWEAIRNALMKSLHTENL